MLWAETLPLIVVGTAVCEWFEPAYQKPRVAVPLPEQAIGEYLQNPVKLRNAVSRTVLASQA